ncbi:F0F1 ATP synthase subunit B [Muribaculum intestinale]|uniref:ATP synthase subunit b n=1 Tax=Muribaculum intestinale TaxID=1796646 RepID=A0A1B1SBH0_9BACT|nr:F0F1 ATP synthase subunit B [Muribaculum intestinale]ROS79383.1 ATP synthase F0 subunit B [Muribaculaceae bacterium Isolate-042 (Harlan)]ANU64163.1 ATP synthase F0 subunit B [Muribaculum intestinale]ASB37743.1 ATP synthase F0 subunit B [Muribaculum intestinale]MYM11983.1 F0F1 ATP synthase subunit B [Muribaculum intestinale]PWB05615.1 ATP synthase F0 subunit B [Muribaculum intestinale]
MELFTPEFGLVFWMFVAFAILFFVLWKWGWPAIMKSIDDRADLIDKGVEYAQNAKEQLDNARQEASKYIDEARKQQAEILREADRMKTEIIEEARAAASKEAQKVMDAAKVSIEQERKEARQQFRDEVTSFALDIATKVVRGQMADRKAQTKLVDSLLDEMETNN